MKLFKLKPDFSGCCSFVLAEGQDPKQWDKGFEGVAGALEQPTPAVVRDPEGESLPLPDFTNLAYKPVPTFSERAISKLDGLITDNGELVPVQLHESMRYFGVNVTNVVDVLDETRSQIERFDDGRVMSVDTYVVRDDVKDLPPLFKIPQTRGNMTYVSEAFVARVKEAGLTGFKFVCVFER